MLRRRFLLNGGSFWSRTIKAFKNRVASDGGTFEAEPCLTSGLPLLGQNLYDKASLILTPNGYKAGKLYSLKPTNGSGDLVFSRASSRTRRNASGLIEVLGNNVPALEYTASGCHTISLQQQRTNVYTQSNNFLPLPGAWFDFIGQVPTANATDDPFGQNNGWLFGANANFTTQYGNNVAGTLGATVTHSVFIKKGTSTQVTLRIQQSSNSVYIATTVFNLNTMTVTSGVGTVEDYGNGWYRLSITGTTLAENSFPRGFLTELNGNIFVFGFQLEQGSYVTSYIPTGASTATRIADTAILTGAISIIGQTEGVLYWEGSCDQLTDLIGINQSVVNGLHISRGAGSLYRATIIANSATISFADVGIKTSRVKIALAYKSGDSALFVNGAQVGATNTTAFSFSGALSAIRLNDNYLIGQQAHLVNGVQLYTSRLTNAELAALTTL